MNVLRRGERVMCRFDWMGICYMWEGERYQEGVVEWWVEGEDVGNGTVGREPHRNAIGSNSGRKRMHVRPRREETVVVDVLDAVKSYREREARAAPAVLSYRVAKRKSSVQAGSRKRRWVEVRN